jgi:hypothetical protein
MRCDLGTALIAGAVDPWSATVIVFAVTESTVDTYRYALFVDNDDRVHAVGLAGAAEVLDRLAGSILSCN